MYTIGHGLIRLFIVSDEDVTKKIKSVRTQYSRELQKFKKRPTGTGTDDVYKSKWPHFEELQFLQDFITSRATVRDEVELSARFPS